MRGFRSPLTIRVRGGCRWVRRLRLGGVRVGDGVRIKLSMCPCDGIRHDIHHT